MFEEAIRRNLESAKRDGKDIDRIYVLAELQGYHVRMHLCFGCVRATLDIARSVAAGVLPFAPNITVLNSKLPNICPILKIQ